MNTAIRMKPKLRSSRISADDRVFTAIAYCASILMLLIVMYPLYFICISSISLPNEVLTGKVILWPVGIDFTAYGRIFDRSDIWQSYFNTILYTTVGTTINIVMTMTGAFVLSRGRLIGRKFFILAITFTMYFGGGIIPSYFNLRWLGLLDSIWAVTLPYTINVFNLIIAITFLKNTIPQEMEEAAFIDGCSNIRFYLTIVLPLSGALIGVLTMYYAVQHWNSYMGALVYLKTRSKYPLQIILRETLINSQISSADMEGMDPDAVSAYLNLAESLKYALIVVASVPMLVLYPFMQKFFVKGVMIGSVKG